MADKNLYEDKSAIPKPSRSWYIDPHPSEAPPKKEEGPIEWVYQKVKELGTINKPSRDQMEKSKKYGQ